MSQNLEPTIEDPWSVLDVSEQADQDQIRAAYIEKVKEFPPDRCGEQFERIRDAYAQLKNPLLFRMRAILGESPSAPLASLLDDHTRQRHYVGPAAWLEVIKQQGKGRVRHDHSQ